MRRPQHGKQGRRGLADGGQRAGEGIRHVRIGGDGRPLVLPEVQITPGQFVEGGRLPAFGVGAFAGHDAYRNPDRGEPHGM